jgi:hypothetical protein
MCWPQASFEQVFAHGKTAPFVQVTAARRRPQDHSVLIFFIAESQTSVYEHRTESGAPPRRLDIEIAEKI